MTTKYYAFVTYRFGDADFLPPQDTLAEAVADCIRLGRCHEDSCVRFFKATMDEATFTYTQTELTYIILNARLNRKKMGNEDWPPIRYYTLTYHDKTYTADDAMELVKYIN